MVGNNSAAYGRKFHENKRSNFLCFQWLRFLSNFLARNLTFLTSHRETPDRSPTAANAKRPKR